MKAKEIRQKWNQLLGTNVRQLREKRKMTQEELATQAGIPQHLISLVEGAKRDIRNDTLDKIATGLRVATSTLFPPPNKKELGK